MTNERRVCGFVGVIHFLQVECDLGVDHSWVAADVAHVNFGPMNGYSVLHVTGDFPVHRETPCAYLVIGHNPIGYHCLIAHGV